MKSEKKMYFHYINRDFQYLFIRIRNHYYSTGKNLDPESVHDLRVEIKRLYAFWKLIETLNPKFDFRKNFKTVKRLFKAAAILRDVQVQLALTREWETRLDVQLLEYNDLMKQKEKVAKAELVNFLQNWDLKKLKKKGQKIRKVLADIPTEVAQERANTYLNSLMLQLVTSQADTGQDSEKLHALRTQAKQVRYTLEILLRCLPQIQYPGTIVNRLKVLHHFLGLWHDNEIALEFLENFQEGPATPRQVPFSRLETAVRDEQARLLQNYEEAWLCFKKQLEKQ